MKEIIEIRGQKYEVDVSTLKKVRTPITGFQVGDVFSWGGSRRSGDSIVILQCGMNQDKYIYGGCYGCPFTCFAGNPRSREEVLRELNRNMGDVWWVFEKNINNIIAF